MRKKIIPQMFDIRPVDETGDLDWKKIQSIGNVDLRYQEDALKKQVQKEKQKKQFLETEKKRLENYHNIVSEKILTMQKKGEEENVIMGRKMNENEKREKRVREEAIQRQENLKKIAQYNRIQQKLYEEAVKKERERQEKDKTAWLQQEIWENTYCEKKDERSFFRIKKSSIWEDIFSFKDVVFQKFFSFQFVSAKKSFLIFAGVAFIVLISIGSVSYASKGLGLKEKILGKSQEGYANINEAITNLANQNFSGSSQNFSEAYANFAESSRELEDIGGILMDVTRFIPFASKVSSGKNAIEAGKHFSAAGKSLNEVMRIAAEIKNSASSEEQNSTSFLELFSVAEKNIALAKNELDLAQKNINRISIDDLPQDKQEKFLLLKKNLPEIRSSLDSFLGSSHIFTDLLGGNGPRKYLFLFQNNSEMRATGGFVGSYGLLDIANGHIKNFFIDGIFNPDGQLKDKIVPPEPIQKISAAWSMHDSNWFPDFPMSAKKAIMFYEKTGGPTADGVITLTPTLMQKLLEITGPIEMSDYGVTLDAKNFVELTQNEVEVAYDKEENKPKKILSDLAPLLLEKLFASKDLETILKTADVFLSGLREKDILLFSQNAELQKFISEQGWSGEILPASKDYLSVINSNINGFKTDAVIEEHIVHEAEIQSDGRIVDTVTITRKHNGGDSQYEWFNKVNADYMRVYVPKGSKLLEVIGQTREINSPPLDYNALKFKRDEDVEKEEQSISIDPESGTKVYDENNKTVFANWTYVSPQEEMTIIYKYQLPFSLFKIAVKETQQVDSYSLVIQKQAGSFGSSFVSNILYPSNFEIKWIFPDNMEKNSGKLKNETILKTDVFEGVVFEKK